MYFWNWLSFQEFFLKSFIPRIEIYLYIYSQRNSMINRCGLMGWLLDLFGLFQGIESTSVCVCVYVFVYISVCLFLCMCVCLCVFVYFANGLAKLLSIISAHPSKSFPLVAYMYGVLHGEGTSWEGCSLRQLGQRASQDKCGQVRTSPSMRCQLTNWKAASPKWPQKDMT